MKKDLNEMEEVFRLMREMLAEIEGLKHIMTGGATTISEKAYEKVQNMVEKAFNPLEPIKLSQEAFNKVEKIDNTPLTEKELESIKKFKERVNKFYGTMKDKDWIHKKYHINNNPKEISKEKPCGDISPAMKTREEIESKLSELETVARYMKPNEQERILGWINALKWVLNRTCIIFTLSMMDNK